MVSRSELTSAYIRLTERIFETGGTVAGQAFRNLGSWRDSDLDKYISNVTLALAGLKANASKLSIAYYGEIAKIEGKPFTPITMSAAELTTGALRNGATSEIVYKRPFVDMWTALSKGQIVSDAIEAGAIRATGLARTELQLARRQAGLVARNSNDNIVGYLRVLSGSENCALCYVASTQRYKKGDLQPIHPGCDCGEMPIYGDSDPGRVVDQQLLDATHQAVTDRFGGSDPTAIGYNQIAIRDHGELGPLLTVADQNFTGPSDLPPGVI